ncbi:DUF6502 family protein [soil metagenome]
MGPLVELLVREGVSYPRLANALKTSFLTSAEKILADEQARVNDSSLSTLSGIHRKDVRVWRAKGQTGSRPKHLGPVTEVYARWASDPNYCDKSGKPRILDRTGALSFEELATSVSKDVHPHALLQELIRLGVVRKHEDGGTEKLELCADAFVPKEGSAEMMQLFSDNVGDHIATAVNNLQGNDPMLEQAVFADELSAESVEALSALARQIWLRAFREVVLEATKLSNNDEGNPDANQRVRFGMYFFRGPLSKP